MGNKNSGMKTTYKPEYAQQAYKLCLLGFTDVDLARFFEVTEQTINNWKNKHEDFILALKNGKEVADAEIAASLFHRAKGYSHPEDKFFQMGSEIHVEQTTKHYPPDTKAALAWLNNRQSAMWRFKQEEPNTGDAMAEAINKLVDKLPS